MSNFFGIFGHLFQPFVFKQHIFGLIFGHIGHRYKMRQRCYKMRQLLCCIFATSVVFLPQIDKVLQIVSNFQKFLKIPKNEKWCFLSIFDLKKK